MISRLPEYPSSVYEALLTLLFYGASIVIIAVVVRTRGRTTRSWGGHVPTTLRRTSEGFVIEPGGDFGGEEEVNAPFSLKSKALIVLSVVFLFMSMVAARYLDSLVVIFGLFFMYFVVALLPQYLMRGCLLLALCAILVALTVILGIPKLVTAVITDGAKQEVSIQESDGSTVQAPDPTPVKTPVGLVEIDSSKPLSQDTSDLHFAIGDKVVNVNNGPVNLRRSPGYENKPDGDIITTVPEGTQGFVVGGSEQADGLVWWPVRFDQYEGWMAERNREGIQLLGPVQ